MKKAIGATLQAGGYPCFMVEPLKPADLGKDYNGKGKKHDPRTNHIVQGGAMNPEQPPKDSR